MCSADAYAYREKVLLAKDKADAAQKRVADWIEENSEDSHLMASTAELKKVQHEAAMIRHQYYMLLAGIWNSAVTDDIERKLVGLSQLNKGVYPEAVIEILQDGREEFWFIGHNNKAVCLYRVDTKRGDLLNERCTFGSQNSATLWDIQENWEKIRSSLESQAQLN